MMSSSTGKHKYRQPKKLSIEELLIAAEQATTVADPKHAITLYTVALQKSSDDIDIKIDILEKRAELYVSIENQDNAIQDYKSALEYVDKLHQQSTNDETIIEILERKASLYMYIGQLSTSEDALLSYQHGIECLQLAIDKQSTNTTTSANDNVDNNNNNNILKNQLSTAYATIAELYLTDLCYEENAEQECERTLQLALTTQPNNIDALQAMANLRLSQQQNNEDAMQYILQVFTIIKIGCQALASLVGMRENNDVAGATELMELDDVQNLPGFEFRCQTAKLLLECAGIISEQQPESDNSNNVIDKQQECVQAAIDVLGSLLAENDEVIEIWTLAGDAFAMLEKNQQQQGKPNSGDEQQQKQQQPPLSIHYWERALEMLIAVKDSLREEQRDARDDMDEEDEIQQQLDVVECQIDDIKSKLEEVNDQLMEE